MLMHIYSREDAWTTSSCCLLLRNCLVSFFSFVSNCFVHEVIKGFIQLRVSGFVIDVFLAIVIGVIFVIASSLSWSWSWLRISPPIRTCVTVWSTQAS